MSPHFRNFVRRRDALCRSLRREVVLTALALGICDCGGGFVPVAPSVDDTDSGVVTSAVDASAIDAGSSVPDSGLLDSDAALSDAGIGDATDATDATVDAAQTVDDAGNADGATVDGSDGAIEAAPACDATKDPKDDPCVISDAYAVFVVSSAGPTPVADAAAEAGVDSSSPLGSMNNPVVGVGVGISLAAAQGKSRVYVCNGLYGESVSLTSPISLFGGFSCVAMSGSVQWAWVGGVAQVNASEAALGVTVNALRIDGLGVIPIAVEDMGFATPRGLRFDPQTGMAASSVAAFVTGSNVSFLRVSLTAGPGGSAGQSAAPSQYSGPAPAGQVDQTPGTTTCAYSEDGVTFDSSTGGTGGSLLVNGGVNAVGGGEDPGTAGSAFPAPVYVDLGVGLPADGAGGAFDEDGDNGEDGAPRPAGAASPTAGHLSASGWTPATGGAGPAGEPGQGGGGSGSVQGRLGNYDGAGGGAGGCGGLGGVPGNGGGASIALASFASTVSLSACTLVTGQAGNGAVGSSGGDGQIGGSGGATQFDSILGGTGGNGAGGSGGAGGPGGISVGILYAEGPVPSFDPSDTTITPGNAGKGGLGGAAGAGPGSPGNAGATGTVDPRASSTYWLSP